jgi:hypothetical protein
LVPQKLLPKLVFAASDVGFGFINLMDYLRIILRILSNVTAKVGEHVGEGHIKVIVLTKYNVGLCSFEFIRREVFGGENIALVFELVSGVPSGLSLLTCMIRPKHLR